MEVFQFFITLPLFLLSSISIPVIATTNENDLHALLFFKSLISHDQSGILSSWNKTLPYCQWPGVVCSRHHPDRVTAIVLDSKGLSGQISPSVANLTFLQMLSLSDNKLTGSIPEELGRLSKLNFINLTMNFLDGSIPATLGNCSNLKVLSLEINKLGGTIPVNLTNCKKLSIMDLSKNELVGGIPSEFGSLFALSILSLGNNNLTGTIPSTLGNLTNLVTLYLHFNRIFGSIPSSFGKLQSLKSLYIYDNYISGKVPNSLYNISTMVDLELSTNQLEGILPSDFCEYLPNLQTLCLYENQLNGKIPISLGNCSSLVNIVIGYNSFTGTITSNLGKLRNLYSLDIADNQFEARNRNDWDFFNSLVNCTKLQKLNLGHNHFEGIIPRSVGNLSTSLDTFALNANPISGNIPTEINKLTNLIALNLGQTSLSGNIPIEIASLRKLQMLDLSRSNMSGEIPSTFGNLTAMTTLYLQNNKFEGHIPPELGNLRVMVLLNLSNNKLIGEIPKEIMNLPSLSRGLYLSNNYLHGAIPLEISKLENVMEVSLSSNNLSGEIPKTIDGCQLLQILHLHDNFLHGSIPPTLSNIKGLQELDLSNNFLSDKLPEFLAGMKLRNINISFNNFEGQLPVYGVFGNISAIDVRGNPKLCGGIPQLNLPQCNTSVPPHNLSRNFVIIITLVSMSTFCIIIVVWLLASIYSKKRSQNNPQHVTAMKFGQYGSVSYNDLLRASNAFSLENLIGKGTFGVVFRANMSFDHVEVVAVKVLNLEQHGACKSFFSECEALRNIRHRNVMKILSVCSSIDHKGQDFKALVFEFMPNGSLEAWLHNVHANRPFRSLNILEMLHIAIDVATALDYLHNHGPIPIVHCDLKPSNVLLDENLTARVSDFGLARLLVQPETSFHQSTASTCAIKGSIGYIPPEYGMGGQPSTEGDVYSYGILLLEMFTRISPTNDRFRDGLNLCKYVEAAYPEEVLNIIDSKLLSVNNEEEMSFAIEDVEDCLVSVIELGLLCSKESPKERIAMKVVLKELNLSRDKLLRWRASNCQINDHYV